MLEVFLQDREAGGVRLEGCDQGDPTPMPILLKKKGSSGDIGFTL